MQETKSKWTCIYQQERDDSPVEIDADLFHTHSQQLLNEMSYYKFAAKMIGEEKRVLNLACREGLGAWVLAKECGSCLGVNRDAQAIALAKQNFDYPSIAFSQKIPEEKFDAIVSFESIDYQNLSLLQSNGIAILTFAEELKGYFGHVFPFSAYDQMIRVGYFPKSDFVLALCCNLFEKEKRV